ncbi:MAG: O-antigen ligase family protein [Deltaproteobacteria bacterium]|nr:O-antigen ligase family protein [Deltaproteobacteria bacterium]
MTVASLLGIITFCVGVPFVTGALYAFPRLRRPMLILMVFTTCHIKKPFYMEVFFEAYRGVDRGFAVTIPDLFFFGFLFWLILGGSKQKLILWPYNSTLWLILVFISILSLTGTRIPYYGLFTIHKFIRAFLLFWVMVNIVRDREDVKAVIAALIAAVLFQGWVVFLDKYITRAVVNRSVGSFPHPNTLAMYIDLIIPAILSLILSDRFTKKGNRWAVMALFAGMLCVVFTKSRAALVIMIGALSAVTAISIFMKPTARKMGIVFIGFLLVDMIGIAVAPKIIKRFQTAPEASERTRDYFNRAAKSMARDHLLGTGINSYSWMLENTDYYWQVYPKAFNRVDDLDAFRESKRGQSRLGTAHHIYLLFAAETGWVGMWVFILFIARLFVHNIVLLLKTHDTYYQAILLGLLLGFTTLHMQGLLEWVFRQTQVLYLFFVLSGLMVAIGNIMTQETRNMRASTN